MQNVIDHLGQASAALADIAAAQQPGANTNEELARQVDAEYARIANHLGNLVAHLLDLHTNPRPALESYSAKV